MRLGLDARLAHRLDAGEGRPLAVAVSGGGDSILALHLMAAWARTARRPILALYVDHGLQARSAAFGQFVRETADRLGAGFEALAWEGEKPKTGIAAAARQARHRLLAQAARRIGACVVVTGHTADDALENARLGQGALSEWSPSPVWPQGRGVFLLRPLLAMRRAEVRERLVAEGIGWIDDPTNDDERQPRIRARREISDSVPPLQGEGGSARSDETAGAPPNSPTLIASRSVPPHEGAGGILRLERAGLDQRTLGAALLSAGGQALPPRREKLERLLAQIGEGHTVATLAGAKLEASGTVTIAREGGRRGLSTLSLRPGETGVWDGRYEIGAGAEPLEVRALKGLAASLPADQRRRLKEIDPLARPTLPVVVSPGGLSCPILAEENPLRIRSLIGARFRGALGLLGRESEL